MKVVFTRINLMSKFMVINNFQTVWKLVSMFSIKYFEDELVGYTNRQC